MLIGLARTSTDEQKAGLEAQVETLRKLGVDDDHLFVEEASSVGKRPVLDEVLKFCRKGDTLVVTSLSRLARSVPHLWEIVQHLQKKGVALRILDLAIDTRTPNGRLMMTLLGGIVQWEREIMLERQRSGSRKPAKKASSVVVSLPPVARVPRSRSSRPRGLRLATSPNASRSAEPRSIAF
jgi:DNA invertase Pin-like site-specific DNA recombinase